MSEIKDFFGGDDYSFSGYLPGMVLMIPFIPSNINTDLPGFHYCDGALYNISNYSDLYDVIGTRYGGDGVNTFAVPDYTGLFLRGRDDGSGYDPDIPSRTLNPNVSPGDVGSIQDQEILSHNHYYYRDSSSSPPQYNVADHNSLTGWLAPIEYVGDIETRPDNYALVFVIKY